MDEATPAETEVKPSYLDEVRKEREAMEKIRDDTQKALEEIKKIKAEDILAGRAPQPKEEAKVEESPQDYLKKVLEGKVEKK